MIIARLLCCSVRISSLFPFWHFDNLTEDYEMLSDVSPVVLVYCNFYCSEMRIEVLQFGDRKHLLCFWVGLKVVHIKVWALINKVKVIYKQIFTKGNDISTSKHVPNGMKCLCGKILAIKLLDPLFTI